MDFPTWLRQWLKRHPLKDPPQLDRARFTAEVMARVRRVSVPSSAAAPQTMRQSWPLMRLGWIAATAVAGIALIVGTTLHGHRQRADRVVDDMQLLALVNESDAAIQHVQEMDDPEALAGELELIDQLTVLAEATPSDQQEIERALQLLEQLDEDAPEAAINSSSDGVLIEELQQLDEQEYSAT